MTNESLGNGILCDHLLKLAVPQHLHLLRATYSTAQREHATLSIVGIRWRVWNAQRTVNTVAIFHWLVLACVGIVAGFTEVCRAKAAVNGDTATELALPVDLRAAMLLARSGASTDLAQNATLAEKILLFRVLLPTFSVCHLLLAVDQASEVRLLALMALVEGASVVREFLRFAEVGIARRGQALVSEKTLLLRIIECLFLNELLQGQKRAKLPSDRP